MESPRPADQKRSTSTTNVAVRPRRSRPSRAHARSTLERTHGRSAVSTVAVGRASRSGSWRSPGELIGRVPHGLAAPERPLHHVDDGRSVGLRLRILAGGCPAFPRPCRRADRRHHLGQHDHRAVGQPRGWGHVDPVPAHQAAPGCLVGHLLGGNGHGNCHLHRHRMRGADPPALPDPGNCRFSTTRRTPCSSSPGH